MEKIVWGDNLSNLIDKVSFNEFKDEIIQGKLVSKKVERVFNGDIRYWGVDPEKNTLLSEFHNFAIEEYQKISGRKPSSSTIMINYIDFEKSPSGSGAGWHRDMWKNQYKAFMYLNDVNSDSQGAFAYIDNSNSFILKAISLANRAIFKGNRYNSWYIKLLNNLGFKTIPVLKEALKPFFLNTSLIHRGLEIKEGYRIMATVYLFDKVSDTIPLK
jgi:hypothetical protein